MAAQITNEILIKEFLAFIENRATSRLSRNLRRLLLEFLQTDAGRASIYVEDLVADLQQLFLLLDAIDDVVQLEPNERQQQLISSKALLDLIGAS